jgi:hypothetical protein
LFRFNVETGSFGVSKQPKQTKDQPKQQQICSNINQIAHPINSVCFGCFDTYPKHRNKLKQTEKFYFGFRETNRKTTETD